MNNPNCPYNDNRSCDDCDMLIDEECNMDNDQGGTGHGDISYSDAEGGL